MADVRPLAGIRYSAADHLAALVTPPYDVISPEAQAEYYERHPENIIRLELGRDEPGDDDLNNRYSRAAVTFAEWRLQGVMRQDSPSLYLYQQRFTSQGTSYRRLALLARVRLEPWSHGVVLPHERTLSRPKDDRLHLLDACAANFSPIMALYEDPNRELQKVLAKKVRTRPLANFIDDAGEEHRLWRVAPGDIAEKVADFFRDRQLYIADGHHRYETCLTYRDQKTAFYASYKETRPEDAINFTLMALCALDDPGLLVLPTHRIVRGVDPGRAAELPLALSAYFDVETLPPTLPVGELVSTLAGTSPETTAAILIRPQDILLLRLRPEGREAMERLENQEDGAGAWWRRLDVTVLHELILGRGLGITPQMIQAGGHVSYTREAEAAVAAVRQPDQASTLALLLRPTPPGAIRDVARAGDRMPQKSTYFYPKLITGLVINPLW